MDDRPRVDTENIKERLQAQHDALLRLMEASPLDENPDPDKTRSGRLTRLDDLYSQAMNAETIRRRKLELVRIEAALRRLEDGDYGFCTVCGDAIAPARLGVDPAAEQCIRCATSAEQGAGKASPQMHVNGRH